jgi:hypothetical protein
MGYLVYLLQQLNMFNCRAVHGGRVLSLCLTYNERFLVLRAGLLPGECLGHCINLSSGRNWKISEHTLNLDSGEIWTRLGSERYFVCTRSFNLFLTKTVTERLSVRKLVAYSVFVLILEYQTSYATVEFHDSFDAIYHCKDAHLFSTPHALFPT